MKQPIISVVVPVYNVEKYLARCIESIMNQSFNDLEIILVDDGSQDKSGNICDNYAKYDKRIKVIHKQNAGLSDARNKGIEIATGEWIGFVDSDDYIEPNMYLELYNLVVQYEADIAICGVCDCYANKKVFQTTHISEFSCSGIEALRLTLEGKLLAGTVCNKLIHCRLLKNARFLIGKTYEDAFFTPELLLNAKKVACTTRSLYNYWHRADSITTRTFSSRRCDIIEAYQFTFDIVEKRCPELIPYAEFRLYWSYFVVLDSMLTYKKYWTLPCYDKVCKFIKKNWHKIFRNPIFQSNRKYGLLALKFNVRLYRVLMKLHNRRQEIIR